MTLKNIFGGSIMLFIMYFVVGCDIGSNRKPSHVWHTADLANYKKVDWTPTQPIPLSPDTAVRAALTDLKDTYGTNIVWQIESITLKKSFSKPWLYSIQCKSNEERDYKMEFVRVLLSGEVWKQRPPEW